LLEIKESPSGLECPAYIAEALTWLQEKLRVNKLEASLLVVSDGTPPSQTSSDVIPLPKPEQPNQAPSPGVNAK